MTFDEETHEHWTELLRVALGHQDRGSNVVEPDPSISVPRGTEMSQTNPPLDSRPTRQSQVLGSGVVSTLAKALPTGGASWLQWLNPITGLFSLFNRGNDTSEPAQLPVFAPRLPRRSIEYGLSMGDGAVKQVADRDEGGRVRLSESESRTPSQVVVQVQAMDSRSFLDNREEIASAVRQALMESHGLGTVLREFQG